MFITFWFLIPVKNLKDTKEDKKRKYITTSTHLKNNRLITKLLLSVSFILMVLGYFLFSLGFKFLIALTLIFIVLLIIIHKINRCQDKDALNLMRLVVILFLLAIIIDKAQGLKIIAISLALGLLYLLSVMPKKRL
jgi:4-hydroxybenzoate polyprenyltransferase